MLNYVRKYNISSKKAFINKFSKKTNKIDKEKS